MLTRLFFIASLCALSCITLAQSWGDSTRKQGITFTSAEIPPKFPGGLSALNQFVTDHFKHPDKKSQTSSNKGVILRMLIDNTGTPVYAGITKGINKKYNKAALSLVPKMPRWAPALQNGQPVNAWVSVPIVFD